jgi:hypothetical protein
MLLAELYPASRWRAFDLPVNIHTTQQALIGRSKGMNGFDRISEPAVQAKRSERSCENVLFRARVDDAAQLHVLVRSHAGRAYILSSMQHVDGGWQATLRLPCARYRYRYYAEFDGALVYVSPADVEPGPVSMRHFDAVFCVGDQVGAAPTTDPERPQPEDDGHAPNERRDVWRGSVHG